MLLQRIAHLLLDESPERWHFDSLLRMLPGDRYLLRSVVCLLIQLLLVVFFVLVDYFSVEFHTVLYFLFNIRYVSNDLIEILIVLILCFIESLISVGSQTLYHVVEFLVVLIICVIYCLRECCDFVG